MLHDIYTPHSCIKQTVTAPHSISVLALLVQLTTSSEYVIRQEQVLLVPVPGLSHGSC